MSDSPTTEPAAFSGTSARSVAGTAPGAPGLAGQIDRALFEQGVVGVAEVDPSTGRFIRVNQRLCDLLGWTPTDLQGMGFRDITHPDDLQRDLENVRQLVSGTIRGFTREKRYRHQAGHYVWVNLTVSALWEPGAAPGHNLSIFEDISARKSAEAQLEHRERFLDKVMNTSPSLVYIFDLETTRSMFVGRHALDFLGYDAARIAADGERLLSASVHPDDLALMARHHEQCAAAGDDEVLELSYRVRDAHGRWHWIRDRNGVFERGADGRVTKIVGVADDVTAQVEAEQERRENERFLADSQRAARLGWYSFDIAAGRWRSSAILDEIFGITPAFTRDVGGWLAIVHPDEQAGMAEYLQQHVLAARQPFDRQYRIVRVADGQERWVHGRGALTVDPAGNPAILAGVIHDITERRRAEEAHVRLQAQLAQAQKMESVGRLAGGVAHDFNNMLQSILGNVELALADAPAGDTMREYLTEIKRSAERSADLTRQLLAFARRQAIQPKVLDLNDTVAGMLKMLGRLIGENIQLLWAPGEATWPVLMDPGQVDRILANLTVNARDAIDGAGRITIETANVAVGGPDAGAMPDVPPGDYVMLAVTDSGRGLSADARAHLFEPFFTTKRRGQGTGLGLATVFGIVKQNGGAIEVESEDGHGSTFRVYLPRANDDPGQETAPAPERPLLGHETILLVEDERQVLDTARRALERHGYTVIVASTPNEAIERCRAFPGPIDLLVTDVIMPVLNGRELQREILALRPGVRSLFISGYTADVIAPHGLVEAGVEFLQKPFSMQGLLERVRAILDGA